MCVSDNCAKTMASEGETVKFEKDDYMYAYDCVGEANSSSDDVAHLGFEYNGDMSGEKPSDKEDYMDGVNKVMYNVAGGWGGSCICPDGKMYWVGDEMNGGETLYCKGGLSGEVHHFEHELWKGNGVECGVPEEDFVDVYRRDDSVAGEWWATCTCPSGIQYRVGDLPGTGCTQFACYGGVTDGTCNSEKTELASNMVVNCGTHDKSDNVVNQEQHVGAWGGKCTCPDGMVYYVGDISGSGCTEFACVNGVADDVCYGFTDNAWSHKEVVCALGEDDPNMVELNAPNTGGWGATCKCPNGSEYKVADITGSGCEEFACFGGEIVSECYTEEGEWSYKSVTCAEN